ncbi:MAG: sigma-70 family RNA polymerase sigma factor [Myxococcota bacterium]
MAIDVEAYYRRYGPMVLRRCRSVLSDEEQAVDAMHEVFLKLLQSAERLEDRAPSSLLYRMATHVCLNRIRAQGRRPDLTGGGSDLLERIACAHDEEERSLARQMLARLMGRQLESTRTIAVMHLLDGMTLQEVADEVGMSVSGVRKRLRKLRAEVQELERV